MIISDPVYGFISIPRGLLCRLISHPLFQRLERIRQLGMAPMVYPGAHHTRKQHSIGAFHLMQSAFRTLTQKGHFIFDSEIEAAEVAILLHDIGHGPFSHVLEQELVTGVGHEDISRLMMARLNEDFQGELTLAISIFENTHHKPYLHELISSQLDMDRLDYLCRDSFYTGVREGNIGAARLVKMLDIADGRLVVDAKGIYTVENYLMARRLMDWQVYLHKTVLAAEALLKNILRRAKFLARGGKELFASPALSYFLYNEVDADVFTDGTALSHYAALDDSDLLCAVKVWCDANDTVLSTLANCFVNRRLFKVEVCSPDAVESRMEAIRREVSAVLGINDEESAYFVGSQTVSNELYKVSSAGIGMLLPDGSVADVSSLSNIVRGDACSPDDAKTYVLYFRTDSHS